MKNKIYPLLYVALVALAGGFISVFARSNAEKQVPKTTPRSLVSDTLSGLRYRVAQASPASVAEYSRKNPIDLPTPRNINTSVEFDPETRNYIIRTQMGGVDIATPILLTEKEYMNQSYFRSLREYYRSKNADAISQESDNLGFLNMKMGLGKAEKLFGAGGVEVRTQGSAEISLGIKRNNIENPSLPERTRRRTYFDFDEKVQLNVNAKVGDKVNFNLNYDTEATFDFDTKKIKLQYQGKEDEIIKNIEAGNVSMPATGSLIRGSQALFGLKSTMQFGKLKATAILAQQESQSQTVSARGGVQTTPFELSIDQYDENRHFFLSHYFRDSYDKWMSKLPYISSGMVINRLEVWVTNKRGNYDQARNIIGFTDMGEHDTQYFSNSKWTSGSVVVPSNESNNLYQTITSPALSDLREISKASQILDQENQIVGGTDYEKVESARRLDASEYTYNNQLGYISLKSALQPDEVLSVAYEYTMGGSVYQVGEFSSDNTTAGKTLYLKLLKNTSFSPDSKMWDLMMKNVYSLNAYQVQNDKFRLDIVYQSDSTGNYVNYLPEISTGKKVLLKVMNLDRLDSKKEAYPDGFFDYVEGYTINSQNGRIYFPVVEPFGKHLAAQFPNAAIAGKYIFQELYDSTKTVAQQLAEKNKFLLKGEYKSSSGSEIRLNAMNIPRGSVKVTAGGAALTENVDYTVDYSMGVVTILNNNIIESGTPVSVSLENQSTFSMQRKTLAGLNLNYEFSPNFNIGGTIMHLSEKPLTQKVNLGEESVSNTIWGFNTSYRTQFQWLTNLVNKVPFINAKAPSYLTINAEYAKLDPGHPKELEKQGVSYLDDFEATQTGYSLREFYPWQLASTPSEFAESKLTTVDYGKNRALLAWYQIDPIFTRTSSTLMPAHIKADKEQRQNHFVREVTEQEIFPNRSQVYGESSIIPVLNLAYYPKERGPYNVDASTANLNPDGTFIEPAKKWGGIMRKLDITDFESSNFEYIEFWMMDPFVYETGNQNNKGGELVFNLGEVSEDILKDGKKAFENGFTGDSTIVASTNWGHVSKRQSLTYAFDNTSGLRKLQDIGLDGLSTTEEKSFITYASYLSSLKGYLNNSAYAKLDNDPAGDNYHYYRGSDFDRDKVSILNRYKHYNGTDGNSTASEDSPEKYDIASKNVPDVEDLNQDNTLNEYERYFEYRVPITQKDTIVGSSKYITDKRVVTVNNQNVTWYQFKIPIREYDKQVNNIRDFKTIRFIRMYMTGFQDSTILRLATLELVRGEWRTYTQSLNKDNAATSNGKLILSSVNVEENGSRKPVAYILPPGISRVIDPSQPQLTQLNEQSLSLKVKDLGSQDARAVYKASGVDLRQYKRLQMFTHAEKLTDDFKDLQSGDLYAFIRLGSDYRNNYYEYEIPLTLTPEGEYHANSTTDRQAVWPIANMFDFPMSVLTDTKTKRNTEKSSSGSNVTFQTPYSLPDPEKPGNNVTVVGSPSLSEVKTIMIGVRNKTNESKSAEVWFNELRVTGFNEDGGWAFTGNANLTISDIASINLSGLKQTAGFGSVEQSVSQRLTEDYQQVNVAANVELGRLVPEKVKLKAPLFYSYSEQKITPKYNPLDQDLLLRNVLDNLRSQAEKDSLENYTQDIVKVRSLSISSLKFDIQSKKPMPYDPANFSFGYAFNESNKHNPTTAWEISRDYRGMFNYNYSPMLKAWEPFNKLKAKSLRLMKDFGVNLLPNNFGFSTNIMRNYYEMLSRDLNNPTTGKLEMTDPLLSWRKDFLWDKQFSLRWDLTKQIKFNINAATNARIDEPNVPVNRRLFPDAYEDWKDTVNMSLRKLGRPLTFAQTANVTWTVPFNKIGILDWATADLKYNSAYNWDRGAYIDVDTEYGNTIRNRMQIGFDSRLNFEQLYNKVKFLQDVNRKFSSSFSPSSQRRNEILNKREFRQTVSLRKDTTLTIYHNLNNRNVKVIARKADNTPYEISYKVIDNNKIVINNRGTQSLQVTVSQGSRADESPVIKIGQYIARGLMSVRNISVSYMRVNSMSLPSFRPEVGALFGQGREGGLMSPGLDFAFGLTGESFINRAMSRDWLISNDSLVTPAIYNTNEELQIRANVEPLRGLKIEFNANRATNHNKQIQFMYEGMPEVFTGNFTMTTIAISTSLKSVNAKKGYQSDVFDQFLKNVQTITNRIETKYQDVIYPNSGFNQGKMTYPTTYDPKYGGVNSSSADVLIPAFIAAYTGKNAESVDITAFPSLKSILPNWRMTFDGLSQLPFIKRVLKALSLNHAYRCTYSVGSYSSYTNWLSGVGGGDDLGFIRDVLTGNPIPSSPFDISSVSITESFSPLIGIDATLKNNMSIHGEYKDSRNVALNISSNQVVESLVDEFVVGLGYKIADFRLFEPVEKGKSNFKNDLNLRGDISYRMNQALIRKIADNFTQPTSGTSNITVKLSADYALSKALTLRAFLDKQINKPLVSSSSYPVSNTNFGVSMRFALNR